MQKKEFQQQIWWIIISANVTARNIFKHVIDTYSEMINRSAELFMRTKQFL